MRRDSQDNVKKSSNGENSIESLKLQVNIQYINIFIIWWYETSVTILLSTVIQIHDLKLQNNRLKENLKENEKYLQEVRELNSNLQTKIINDFEELKGTLIYYIVTCRWYF